MAVIVSPNLVHRHIKTSDMLRKAWEILESDEEIQEIIKMG